MSTNSLDSAHHISVSDIVHDSTDIYTLSQYRLEQAALSEDPSVEVQIEVRMEERPHQEVPHVSSSQVVEENNRGNAPDEEQSNEVSPLSEVPLECDGDCVNAIEPEDKGFLEIPEILQEEFDPSSLKTPPPHPQPQFPPPLKRRDVSLFPVPISPLILPPSNEISPLVEMPLECDGDCGNAVESEDEGFLEMPEISAQEFEFDTSGFKTPPPYRRLQFPVSLIPAPISPLILPPLSGLHPVLERNYSVPVSARNKKRKSRQLEEGFDSKYVRGSIIDHFYQ